MNHPLLEQVTSLYEHFDPALIKGLDRIYDTDVVFEDPMHRITGLANLRGYFSGLIEGLDECRFEFSDILEKPGLEAESGQAVLLWQMHYRHRKLRGGKPLAVTGSSHLRYGERVHYHRDYFDAGAMLYEHIPLLGCAIRSIKKRLE